MLEEMKLLLRLCRDLGFLFVLIGDEVPFLG